MGIKLRSLFRRAQADLELERELAEHIERETEELIARGIPPVEARRQARAKLGNVLSVKEQCRDARGVTLWEQLTQDAAFGIRLLLKKRTFSVIALATMALGIGSTTAVFSLVDQIILRPLPFPAQDRLFYVNASLMPGHLDILRGQIRLADYAAYKGVRPFTAARGDWPERIRGCEVSANFFDVLGSHPMLGRVFEKDEDRPGKEREAVLAYEFWQEEFGGQSGAVGQQVTLDEISYRIIGVMPPEFHYPPMSTARFWIPLKLDPRNIGMYWGAGGMSVIGRLRSGASLDAAQAELDAWIPRLRKMFPWRMPDAWGAGVRLQALLEHVVASARLRSLMLLGVAALVLMIAVVNVANLMVGQTAARQRELAVRASLGASPGRLARQLLTESLILAMSGGVLGSVLAFAQVALLKRLLPSNMPRLADVAIDARVLVFTAGVSIASGLLFGLLPGWQTRRQRSLAAIDSNRTTISRRGLRADSALVVSEAALATILLIGAGLLLRTFWSLLQVDPGFRPDGIVTAELSMSRAAAATGEKSMALFEQIHNKLAEYPGVRDVAAMQVLPLTPDITTFAAAIEDYPRPPEVPQFVLWSTAVTPNYVTALGIHVLEGRGFTPADRAGAPLVALVSRSTAQRYWPNRSPLGRRLKPSWDKEWRIIVGVVDDVKYFGMTGPPNSVDGEIYLPVAQDLANFKTVSLVVRIEGDLHGFEKALPPSIREVCASCAISKIVPMKTVVAHAVEAPRSMAWLVGSFALLALGLAGAGIYGVVSHGVIRRTRELGVRLALGATRGGIAWLVLRAGLSSTLAGALAGLAVAWILARPVRTLLYGIPDHDPLTFSVAPTVLLAAAFLAGLIPMLRAIRIDPAESLRDE